jgi:hypothetical protein
MITHIKYTKESGETSHRAIYPTNVLDLGTDKFKVQAIDLSDMTDEERHEAELVLDAIRQQATNAIRDSGLSNRWRSFFYSGIDFKD